MYPAAWVHAVQGNSLARPASPANLVCHPHPQWTSLSLRLACQVPEGPTCFSFQSSLLFVLFSSVLLRCRSFISALVPPIRYIARYLRPGLLTLSNKRGLLSLRQKATLVILSRFVRGVFRQTATTKDSTLLFLPHTIARSRPTSSLHQLESCTSHFRHGWCCLQHCYRLLRLSILINTATIAIPVLQHDEQFLPQTPNRSRSPSRYDPLARLFGPDKMYTTLCILRTRVKRTA